MTEDLSIDQEREMPQSKKNSRKLIEKYSSLVNIVPEIEKDEQRLDMIACQIIETYERDMGSRSEWDAIIEKSMELAKLEGKDTKNFPFEGASNVKYPLLTTICIQIAARLYPEIVKNGQAYLITAIGQDPNGAKQARAKRVTDFSNFQILVDDTYWEEQLDKSLFMYLLIGTIFKKTYWDPIKRKPLSELVTHDQIFVNQNITSLEEARAVTHKMWMHSNELLERMRSGLFTEMSLSELKTKDDTRYPDEQYHEILEQHCFLDLDNDGYEEPYIVTVHEKSRKVLRIVNRWNLADVQFNDKGEVISIPAIQYFTDFHCIPAPDGTFYSYGFGTFLYNHNITINSLINQLIDAGKLANLQGGFLGKGVRIRGGRMITQPGEYIKLDGATGEDLAKNIYTHNYKEPSPTLVQLLAMLVDSSKELASVSEIVTGNEKAQNAPATTVMALIEQGTKVYTSIQRRLYRSLKKEFEKLYQLNSIFLDEETYMKVLDDPNADVRSDFEMDSFDIRPVSDPNISSVAQRMTKAQALMALLDKPFVNSYEVMKRFVETLEIPNPEVILQDPNTPPPPNPKMVELEIEQEIANKKLMIEAAQVDLKAKDQNMKELQNLAQLEKMQAEIMQLKANAIKLLSEASSTGMSADINKALSEVTALEKRMGMFNSTLEAANKVQNAKV